MSERGAPVSGRSYRSFTRAIWPMKPDPSPMISVSNEGTAAVPRMPVLRSASVSHSAVSSAGPAGMLIVFIACSLDQSDATHRYIKSTARRR